jgi:hypothetical protein
MKATNAKTRSLKRAMLPDELRGHITDVLALRLSNSQTAQTLLSRVNGAAVNDVLSAALVVAREQVGQRVAELERGETTSMTTFTSSKKLDVERGVRLAKHAYRSRKKGQEPPAIVKAYFEGNGQILETYSGIDLEEEEAPL